MVGKYNRDALWLTVAQGNWSTEKGMVNMDYVHLPDRLAGAAVITQVQIRASLEKWESKGSVYPGFLVLIIKIAECKYVYLVTSPLQMRFIQRDICRNPAGMRFIDIRKHSNFHNNFITEKITPKE